MSIFKRKEVILLLRLVVGVTFVYAAYDKILHPHAFAIAVRGYQIIPVDYSNLFAISLAWAEMVAGVLLIVGALTRQAAGAVFLLLGMFVAAIVIVLIRGMVIDCGCFSSEGGTQTGPLLIVRNVLLMAACVVIVFFDRGWFSLGRLLPARG